MKLGMVDKLTIVHKLALHSLHRNITRLAINTLKTTVKLENMYGRINGKEWWLLIHRSGAIYFGT